MAQMSVGPLDLGRTKKVRFQVGLPAGTSASGTFAIAVPDVASVVNEANEKNNAIVSGPVP